MTLFLKADLTPEEQMQQVSRKYPEADFSSISLDPGIMAGGKSQSFGQEEAGGCGGSQEGWLSRALRQLPGVGIKLNHSTAGPENEICVSQANSAGDGNGLREEGRF